MTNNDVNRPKRINFSENEKNDLKRILLKYKWLVDKDTKTNDASNKAKKEAWEKVTVEFNEIAGHQTERTAAQLKKLWENMKCQHRNHLTKKKVEVLKTGDGELHDIGNKEDSFFEILTTYPDIELKNDSADSDFHFQKTSVSNSLPSTSASSSSNTEIMHVENTSKTGSMTDDEEMLLLEEEIQHEEEMAKQDEVTLETEMLSNKWKKVSTSKRTQNRERVIENLIEDRKKIMKIEHHAKMKFFEEKNKAKLEYLEEKKAAAVAKRKYYEMKCKRACE